jgi:hypothetical protein
VRRRHAWGWALAAAALGLVVPLALVAAAVPWRSETLRKQIIEALSDRFDSDVALSDVTLRAFPRLHAEGGTLLIKQRGRTGVPPLIAIRTFKVDAGLIGVWRRHVAHVEIVGLDISIPPREDGGGPVGALDRIGPSSPKTGVIIDTLDASDARLIVIPRGKAKAPETWKTWAIHTLTMHRVGIDESMPYQATLTNAVPPGEVQTAGDFGPWDRDDPGGTPLNGTFTFDNADLGVFKGVKGTLSSRGSFGGSLGWIDVNGETDTPNLAVDVGGHPFPLHATYHTIVDGTNGDTRLERIDATLVRSTLAARGAVLDAPPGTGPGRKGRTVELHVDMPKARVEDVMTMAVRAPKPPMVGALKLTTTFLLPPGDADVVDRLKLNGRFDISQARFANYDVQGKIAELSQRAQGKRPDRERAQVASNFQGRFILERGVLTLSDLSFDVPGARVKLAGRYALAPETIDFKGDLLMSAKVSQTVSGFRSLLLKIVDPLFKGPGGGSSIPIVITGTRSDPRFGIDLHRVFKR